ncbi:MAG: HAD-IA family hydrolase [Oligoflexia bacterium]|nr:HAD-IA family hydrolase [Oligoflexia bacterium]
MLMKRPINLLMDYDNIIFDLGGVILNIDYNLTVREFSKLFSCDANIFYNKNNQLKFFSLLETGKMSAQSFRDELRNMAASTTSERFSDEQLDYAWNCMLLNYPIERLELLLKIKKLRRIFLLSNINEIHEKECLDRLNKLTSNSSFDPYFEKVYLSHRVGLRKPHKEIFELVLKENNLNPLKTVFIDDSIQHVEGARNYGIDAIHLTTSIMDYFPSEHY